MRESKRIELLIIDELAEEIARRHGERVEPSSNGGEFGVEPLVVDYMPNGQEVDTDFGRVMLKWAGPQQWEVWSYGHDGEQGARGGYSSLGGNHFRRYNDGLRREKNGMEVDAAKKGRLVAKHILANLFESLDQ